MYIYLFDVSQVTLEEVEKDIKDLSGATKRLIVANKTDLVSEEKLATFRNSKLDMVFISAKEKKSLEILHEKLLEKVEIDKLDSDQLMVTNSRHYDALVKSLAEIEKVQEGIDQKLTGDLLAIDLRQAIYHLGEITGQVSNDELLGNIFSNFCIGK